MDIKTVIYEVEALLNKDYYGWSWGSNGRSSDFNLKGSKFEVWWDYYYRDTKLCLRYKDIKQKEGGIVNKVTVGFDGNFLELDDRDQLHLAEVYNKARKKFRGEDECSNSSILLGIESELFYMGKIK